MNDMRNSVWQSWLGAQAVVQQKRCDRRWHGQEVCSDEPLGRVGRCV